MLFYITHSVFSELFQFGMVKHRLNYCLITVLIRAVFVVMEEYERLKEEYESFKGS